MFFSECLCQNSQQSILGLVVLLAFRVNHFNTAGPNLASRPVFDIWAFKTELAGSKVKHCESETFSLVI